MRSARGLFCTYVRGSTCAWMGILATDLGYCPPVEQNATSCGQTGRPGADDGSEIHALGALTMFLRSIVRLVNGIRCNFTHDSRRYRHLGSILARPRLSTLEAPNVHSAGNKRASMAPKRAADTLHAWWRSTAPMGAVRDDVPRHASIHVGVCAKRRSPMRRAAWLIAAHDDTPLSAAIRPRPSWPKASWPRALSRSPQ